MASAPARLKHVIVCEGQHWKGREKTTSQPRSGSRAAKRQLVKGRREMEKPSSVAGSGRYRLRLGIAKALWHQVLHSEVQRYKNVPVELYVYRSRSSSDAVTSSQCTTVLPQVHN